MPAPLPQISALPLHPLALNPHPLPSVSLKGQGGPLLLPLVVHAHSPLLTALSLLQVVPPILPSNVPAPLDQISVLSLQQGGPSFQNLAVIPPPPISALLLQQYLLAIQPSAMCVAPTPLPLSV